MMEVARASETSADNYFTRQYIPEDKSELHTRRRENLKSYIRFSCNSAVIYHGWAITEHAKKVSIQILWSGGENN
jgi:hypothetical protein